MTRREGQGLVEFSVVTLMTVLMLLFVVEMGRAVLVYTTVANAAEEGVRYATVHGSSRTVGTAGSSPNSASGPTGGSTCATSVIQVCTVVQNFASAAPLTTSRLVITVTYTKGPKAVNANDPGSTVTVTAVYPYDPLTTYFSNALRLGSSSTGVITY